MNRLKKPQSTSTLKYISKKRKEEVNQTFKTLGLMHLKNLPNYSYLSEGYNEPFKQFSVLKTKELVFKSTR